MSAPVWKAADICRAVNGKITGGGTWEAHGVSIDSRTVKKGDLFVALHGPTHDGHVYADKALADGAVAAVVSAGLPLSPLVMVADTFRALEDLGRAGRARSGAKIAAVTGSVGKTGTKEMLRVMLAACGDAYANEGSLNNHWGVPLSLARMPQDAAYGVFELGMNHAGELGPLSRMVKPQAALITNVEAVHLEFFPSVEAIADAKAEIFEGLEKSGAAILNRDNPHFERLQAAAKAQGIAKILSFGRQGADAALLDYQGDRITARVMGREMTYRLPVPGEHMAINSLGALLTAAALGADAEKCAAALAGYRPPQGRGTAIPVNLPNGAITLIDESYNASPASVEAAIGVLGQTQTDCEGRRIAVLGDMLELGAQGGALHKTLAAALAAAKITSVYACGPLMRQLFDVLPVSMRGEWTENSQQLAARLAPDLRAGDLVMIKGSHGTRMDLIVKALKELDKSPAEQKSVG